MRGDLGVPVLLGVLALAVLPASGLLGDGLVGVAGYLTFVLAFTAFCAMVVFPWIGEHGVRGIRRVGAMAVVSAPFVVFGLLESERLPGEVLLPAPAWWLALAAGIALAALPSRQALLVGVVVLALLGLDAVLGAAGRPLLPRAWVAAAGPVTRLEGEGAGPAAVETPPVGLRPGDPVRVGEPALGQGPGPWYVPAPKGREAPGTSLIGVFGEHLPEGGRPGTAVVPARTLDPADVLTLDALSAFVLPPGTWPAEAGPGAAWADALAVYVRRGGLLVGPAPDRPWPRVLARRLGLTSLTTQDGEAAPRPHGLGRIDRAGSEPRTWALIEAYGGAPRLRTLLDATSPRLPTGTRLLGLDPGGRRAGRRGQGLLLLVYALAAAALDRILRRGWPRLLGAVAPALALVAGLLWSSPGGVGLEARGVAFDLGGGGGRRLEAVLLASGDAGWRGRVRWEGGGLVRLAGGRLDEAGRVELGPGERAWVVRESVARGAFAGGHGAEDAAGLLDFVRGRFDPSQARFGRVEALGVEVEGLGRPPAWTLVLP